MRSAGAFDERAAAYDAWYDSPMGASVFKAEIGCFRGLLPAFSGRWLEAGLGTGRFAEALDISLGVDPAPHMLQRARERGICGLAAQGEHLPFADASMDGVLLALTLCFFDDPAKALKECARVLRPGGNLIVGMVPADSPWGRRYRWDAECGHPIYSCARFYTAAKATDMAEKAGFQRIKTCSALFEAPESPPEKFGESAEGSYPGAGFVCMLFVLEEGLS
ncbi:MAG: class I SAM-dependent methyltransferase [Desulfosalsimonadaceae bacterium]